MGLEQILAAVPWDKILIQTVNGIVTGMILALIASGLTLIFGIMDVVNFAHGELFMLGAPGEHGVPHHREFLACARRRRYRDRPARGRDPDDDAAAPARPRPAHHHPRHVRPVPGAPELRALAVRARAAQDQRAHYRALLALLPRVPVVSPAG